MSAVNWRICTVCVLHLTFSPSRYLELYHIKLLASLWLMFYTHLQVLIESSSISGRWAVQGFAMCLFKEGNLRVRGRGGVPSVLSFSFSHSTSPGCLFCIPWHFVKGTERSSLVNPTKKKKTEFLNTHLRMEENFWIYLTLLADHILETAWQSWKTQLSIFRPHSCYYSGGMHIEVLCSMFLKRW